jgi:hypothetical protein
MTARAARTTEAMTEAQLMGSLIDHARQFGYLVFHPTDSRRNEPGYPDLTCVHPETGVLFFMELKTEKGRLRGPSVTKRGRVMPGQAEWIEALAGARVVLADVIRPSDLDDVIATLKAGAGKP